MLGPLGHHSGASVHRDSFAPNSVIQAAVANLRKLPLRHVFLVHSHRAMSRTLSKIGQPALPAEKSLVEWTDNKAG